MDNKRAIFFCSSNAGIDPAFNVLAREMVLMVAKHGYGITSGGSWRGTMGVVGDAAAEAGAEHVGVIPRFMQGLEHPLQTSTKWVDTMSERKEFLRSISSLAVILPGGIGTMDEFFETLVLIKLKRWDGRVIVMNPKGFYDPLKALLDHFVATGMLAQSDADSCLFASTAEEAEKLLFQ